MNACRRYDPSQVKKLTKQLKALKERVKKGDASAEDEMYEVEEALDKANAILKKEKEANTSARIKFSLVKNYQAHPTQWLIYAQAAKKEKEAAKALAKAAKAKEKKSKK